MAKKVMSSNSMEPSERRALPEANMGVFDFGEISGCILYFRVRVIGTDSFWGDFNPEKLA